MKAADKAAVAQAVKALAVHYSLMSESLDGHSNTNYKVWKEAAMDNINELKKYGIDVDLLAY